MASEPKPAVKRDDTNNASSLPVVRQRMPLGRSRRRLSFERRLRLWVAAFATPTMVAVWWYCHVSGYSSVLTVATVGATAILWSLVASYFFEGVIRPLQTLSNIVASLREEDYSFRARGARRGDAMGDLALEVNALASTLQRQRNSAMDALTLADRVMRSMQSPVLAFDADNKLRLVNAAAERAFRLQSDAALGLTAEELALVPLLTRRDETVFSAVPFPLQSPPEQEAATQDGASLRWLVRRSSFRLYGVPHTLFVLSDVAAALREEERLAWQRLIRVLGHEINNSLTPIKSIASMLRSRPLRLAQEAHTPRDLEDFRHGLSVIEGRADSLNRFLQAYQELSRLPPPRIREVQVRTLVENTIPLESRLHVHIKPSPDILVYADPDQLQQLLINLLKNAADAVLDPDAPTAAPEISMRWKTGSGLLVLQIFDNGPGLANPNNLFVPFYTTKQQGAGIGLTLSRQIAAAHHGSLRLYNRTGNQGCVAEVVLPFTREIEELP